MDVNLRVILASCEPRIQEPAVPNASLIKSLSSSSSPLPGYNNEVATSSKVQTKNNKGIFGQDGPMNGVHQSEADGFELNLLMSTRIQNAKFVQRIHRIQ